MSLAKFFNYDDDRDLDLSDPAMTERDESYGLIAEAFYFFYVVAFGLCALMWCLMCYETLFVEPKERWRRRRMQKIIQAHRQLQLGDLNIFVSTKMERKIPLIYANGTVEPPPSTQSTESGSEINSQSSTMEPITSVHQILDSFAPKSTSRSAESERLAIITHEFS